MKKLKKLFVVLAVLVVLAIVGLIILYLSLGKIVKAGVETVGSRVTQCEITVDSVDLALLRGKVVIKGLVVGNPEGFKTDSAFELGEVNVALRPKSFFSDTIVITDVHVDEPQFTYEVGLGRTNIGQILKNVEAVAGPAEEKPEEEPEADGKQKSVQVDHVLVENGKVRISATVLQGKAVPIPLPKVEINDIGKEKEKESPAEVIAKVLKEVLGSVTDVVKQSGKLKDLGLKALNGTLQQGENALEAGKDTLKGAGEKAKKGLSSMLDGVKKPFKKD